MSDVKRDSSVTQHTRVFCHVRWLVPLRYMKTLDPDKERKQAGGNSTKHSSSPLACQPPTGILGQKRAGHVSAGELARLARDKGATTPTTEAVATKSVAPPPLRRSRKICKPCTHHMSTSASPPAPQRECWPYKDTICWQFC